MKDKEIIEEFNKFIKKWAGNSYPHLIDTDENDGENFRQLIQDSLIERFKEGRKQLAEEMILFIHNSEAIVKYGFLKGGKSYHEIKENLQKEVENGRNNSRLQNKE